MGACFRPQQELGPEDLDINFTDSGGSPTNVAFIRYAIYFVDPNTSLEMIVGDPERVPINPSVGSYYASLVFPTNSPAGDYIIRWTVRKMTTSPVTTVVMEFGVVTEGGLILTSQYTPNELDLIRSFRIKLRDNCIAGEEIVELDVDGVIMLVTMEELWEILPSG